MMNKGIRHEPPDRKAEQAKSFLEVKEYRARLKHYIDCSKLPKRLKEEIWEDARGSEGIDYCDGAFYFPVNFVYDKQTWVLKLMKLLPANVVADNKFAIYFSH